MDDPNLLLASTPPEYFKAVPGVRYDYSKRTPAQVAADVNHLYTLFKRQITDNDHLRQVTILMAKSLARERLWRKWLITLIVSMWGVFAWLIKIAAPVIIKGLGK